MSAASGPQLPARSEAEAGGGLVDRVAGVLVGLAARRWPGEMRREWQAELAVMQNQPASRRLRFALSLAVSPVEVGPRVEAWARSLAGAAGVVLLAGGLVNAARVAQHRAGIVAALGVWVVAGLIVGQIGWRSWASAPARTLAIGAGLFVFLLAGNRVAFMPYMGWRDVLPAVLLWTGLTAFAIRSSPKWAFLGVPVALDLATIAGSLRAAGGLGIGLKTAPAWFPLAMLPGGTVTVGPARASELLLANASAMVGPMLLCSIFVFTLARRPEVAGVPEVRMLGPVDARTVWGVTGAIAALAGGELFRRMPFGGLEYRLLDNSAVFGFGFLADTKGQVVTALIAGLIATRLGVARRWN
jgi:hypothetical protein